MQEQNSIRNRLKRLVFLAPALFTAAVVLTAYQASKPVFAEIPALLGEEPERQAEQGEREQAAESEPEEPQNPEESPEQQEAQTQTDPVPDSVSEPASDPEPLPKAQSPDIAGPDAPEALCEDGVYVGVSRGYGGDVRVSVTVEGGRIVSAELIEAEDETKAFLNRALPLLESVTERQTWEVDTVSGATYSSRGILGAVRNALTGETVENEPPEPEPEPEADTEPELESIPAPQAPQEPQDPREPEKPVQPDNPPEPQAPEQPEEPQAVEDPEPLAAVWADGVYIGSAVCDDLENCLYTVTATVTVRDGRIGSISVERTDDLSDDPDLNEEYMDWAVNGRQRGERFFAGIPDQIAASQSAGEEAVDAVSGATYSSYAVRQAVEKALEQAR